MKAILISRVSLPMDMRVLGFFQVVGFVSVLVLVSLSAVHDEMIINDL